MKRVLLLIGIAACGGEKERDDLVATYDGTASYDGKPLKITGCKAAPVSNHTAARFTLDNGMTVIHSPLESVVVEQAGTEPHKPDCKHTGSDTNGGWDGGKGYWYQGEIHLDCIHNGKPLLLDVTFDCGVKERPSNRVKGKKKE